MMIKWLVCQDHTSKGFRCIHTHRWLSLKFMIMLRLLDLIKPLQAQWNTGLDTTELRGKLWDNSSRYSSYSRQQISVMQLGHTVKKMQRCTGKKWSSKKTIIGYESSWVHGCCMKDSCDLCEATQSLVIVLFCFSGKHLFCIFQLVFFVGKNDDSEYGCD